MKKTFISFFISFFLLGCFKPEKADLVVFNAKIQTLDGINSTYQAMAIKDGKIIEFGPERQILNKYRSKKDYDAGGRNIYPGFTDAHTHLLLYAQQRLAADLSEVQSNEKLVITLEKYQSRNNHTFIIGRGLKVNSKDEKIALQKIITQKFPTIPVFLILNDAHSAIINQKGIDFLAKKQVLISSDGILEETDFFEAFGFFPTYPKEKIKEELFDIQSEFLQYGIVAVHEMGWSKDDYLFFQELTKNEAWILQVSAYLLPSKENIKLLKKGLPSTDKLQVVGLKIFLDGTFGSESAAVHQAYKDGTTGKLNYENNLKGLDSILIFASENELQIAAHAAGDKAIEQLLERIEINDLDINNLQWRIEHVQKINPEIIKKLSQIHLIPSLQPYHAISDMEWLKDKMTIDDYFYAYESLLNTSNIIAIGSDIPVEQFNPFQIIWAATNRKTSDGKTFSSHEKLSLNDVLKAYSIYNAQIVHRENHTGTLEVGKDATFFSSNLKIDESFENTNNYSIRVFTKGKEVYSIE